MIVCQKKKDLKQCLPETLTFLNEKYKIQKDEKSSIFLGKMQPIFQ